jgi:hypothetical protein
MCNLYSITTNQAAIIALFRVINRYVGNLPPMPGVFPETGNCNSYATARNGYPAYGGPGPAPRPQRGVIEQVARRRRGRPFSGI